jgi:hypothetical protein
MRGAAAREAPRNAEFLSIPSQTPARCPARHASAAAHGRRSPVSSRASGCVLSSSGSRKPRGNARGRQPERPFRGRSGIQSRRLVSGATPDHATADHSWRSVTATFAKMRLDGLGEPDGRPAVHLQRFTQCRPQRWMTSTCLPPIAGIFFPIQAPIRFRLESGRTSLSVSTGNSRP